MAGRAPKLSTAIQAAVCKAIRLGNYKETAAQAAGIHRHTLENWVARGEAGEAHYVDFFDAVKKAESDAEKMLMRRIRAASIESWQAAAWILERTRSDRFALRSKVEQTTTLKLDTLSDEELEAKYLSALARGQKDIDATGAKSS